MAAVLEVSLDELSSHWQEPVKLDATCGIFGESELIGQILRGYPVSRLCAGVNQTLVKRVMPMLRRFPGENLVLTGGVALNGALVKLLAMETGIAVTVPQHPQHNGAIGCATIDT
jgi:activator of 2-hydroxyglutaryl-CoA dehydratase